MPDPQEKFYLTTPIYYVNDKPHIGHAYTTIVADVIARYWRLRNREVVFLTGTDENSQKNVEAAQKAGLEVQAYVDQMSQNWAAAWQKLGLTVDDFIRTTEDRHKVGVNKFWQAVETNGDIYEGEYVGFYCVGCEAFKTSTELDEQGFCSLHKKAPQMLKEKNFFFKLSAYREKLLKYIDEHPDFIQPPERRNEVRSYVDKFMTDVSISRESVKWGLPVPNHPEAVIYVWFDALLNYMTAIGYGTDEAKFNKFWPADLHLVGKDIIKFHCALWPAMLMSAGLPIPKTVFAHGFFTVDGVKMSKSLGNFIDPLEVVAKYSKDVLRFYLLREIPFGGDGDFSIKHLEERYTNDLGNELGNLHYRVLSMVEKYLDGCVPKVVTASRAEIWSSYEKHMASYNFLGALDDVWGILRRANQKIDQEAPWKLVKTDSGRLAGVLYELLEDLRQVAWLILPIMPETAQKIVESLDSPDEFQKDLKQAQIWGGLPEGARIKKGEPLFPRLTS